MSWTYYQNAESPSFAANWEDGTGTRIDLSTHTFTAKLINISTGVVALTKTTGITGYVSATSPNVVVAWAAGELNVTPGRYKLHITASLGGNDRMLNPGAEPIINILAST